MVCTELLFAWAPWSGQQAAPDASASPKPRAERDLPKSAIASVFPCSGTNDHEREDLCIGWRSAVAAENQVTLTEITAVVGVIGLIGLLITLYYSRQATVATKQAAEAAKLSADAAVAVEMPLLDVLPPEIMVENAPMMSGQPMSQVVMREKSIEKYMGLPKIAVCNYGRTNAIITGGKLGWKICNRPRGEPEYNYGLSFDRGSVVKGNGDATFFLGLPIALDDAAFAASTEQGKRLWIYISIRYLDFLRGKHEARFCWRWGCPGGGSYFLVADDDAPEPYTRHT